MAVSIPTATATSSNAATTATFVTSITPDPTLQSVICFVAYRSATPSAVSITRATFNGQDLIPIGHGVNTDQQLHLTAYYSPYDFDPDTNFNIQWNKTVTKITGVVQLAGVSLQNAIQRVRVDANSGTASDLVVRGMQDGAVVSIIAARGTNSFVGAQVGTNFSREAAVVQTSGSIQCAVSTFEGSFAGNITATWASMSATSNFVHMAIVINPYRGSM